MELQEQRQEPSHVLTEILELTPGFCRVDTSISFTSVDQGRVEDLAFLTKKTTSGPTHFGVIIPRIPYLKFVARKEAKRSATLESDAPVSSRDRPPPPILPGLDSLSSSFATLFITAYLRTVVRAIGTPPDAAVVVPDRHEHLFTKDQLAQLDLPLGQGASPLWKIIANRHFYWKGTDPRWAGYFEYIRDYPPENDKWAARQQSIYDYLNSEAPGTEKSIRFYLTPRETSLSPTPHFFESMQTTEMDESTICIEMEGVRFDFARYLLSQYCLSKTPSQITTTLNMHGGESALSPYSSKLDSRGAIRALFESETINKHTFYNADKSYTLMFDDEGTMERHKTETSLIIYKHLRIAAIRRARVPHPQSFNIFLRNIKEPFDISVPGTTEKLFARWTHILGIHGVSFPCDSDPSDLTVDWLCSTRAYADILGISFLPGPKDTSPPMYKEFEIPTSDPEDETIIRATLAAPLNKLLLYRTWTVSDELRDHYTEEYRIVSRELYGCDVSSEEWISSRLPVANYLHNGLLPSLSLERQITGFDTSAVIANREVHEKASSRRKAAEESRAKTAKTMNAKAAQKTKTIMLFATKILPVETDNEECLFLARDDIPPPPPPPPSPATPAPNKKRKRSNTQVNTITSMFMSVTKKPVN